MKRLLSTVVLLGMFIWGPAGAWGAYYDIQKLGEGIYAAVALPQGKAASNAMIIVTTYQAILVGAHFLPDGIRELVEEIAKITPLPLRHIILTHHHRGFNYLDFDLPANVEVITSWQAWQSWKSEVREVRQPVLFFDKRLTLQQDNVALVLSNTDLGHSEGDVFVYLPKENILFASDLLFNDAVGYMGDGSMREWIMNLELMEGIGARIVIPGIGKVTDSAGITRFKTFFKDFLTEVLRNIGKGNSLARTKKEFSLPQYRNLPGYKAFFDVNVERAYINLKER